MTKSDGKGGLLKGLKMGAMLFVGASIAAAAVGQIAAWKDHKKGARSTARALGAAGECIEVAHTGLEQGAPAIGMPDKCSAIAQMVAVDNLGAVNARSTEVCPKDTLYTRHVKRALDVLLAAPCVVMTLPVNMVLGILTYLDVGDPVLFRQSRLGKGNKPFDLVKFRNMTNETDENGNLLPASERTTKLGAFVRSKSLDELLNFWFILKGDMSFIGPRPLPVEFLNRYSNRHRQRTIVKPGLECPTLDSDGHVRLYQEQFENDIWYVENVSFKVDCKMVIALFKMVFNRKERSDHATVGGGYFVGYDADGNAFSMRRIPEEYEIRYRKLVEND